MVLRGDRYIALDLHGCQQESKSSSCGGLSRRKRWDLLGFAARSEISRAVPPA